MICLVSSYTITQVILERGLELELGLGFGLSSYLPGYALHDHAGVTRARVRVMVRVRVSTLST